MLAPTLPASSHPPFNLVLPAVVKAVPSGDTLLLVKAGPSAAGPPPELRIGLASIRAPSLGRDVGDEAGAFAAREALRKMCIGKRVDFVIEFAVEALGGRLMGSVKVADETESLGVVMARKGLVRVRKVEGGKEAVAKDYELLLKAEDDAVKAQRGIHGDAADLVARAVVPGDVEDAAKVAVTCKGKNLKGVVEFVANGGAMKCYVKDMPGAGGGDRILTYCLSGVQCPGFRGGAPQPFALNAKFMTETQLLHRDVDICVEGCDRNGLLFATIVPAGAKDSASYIGEELLAKGYAKTVGWSIELSKMGGRLRAAERAARDAQLGLWKGFVKKASADGVLVGKCVEVVSGDIVAVLDEAAGEVKRFFLASVRAARTEGGAGKDRSSIPLGPAYDCKEALRRKLIGRIVRVTVAYEREAAESAARKDPMVFAVIGREGDAKNPDVALPLISDGLLSVIRHRGEEDRSPNYEAYLEKEKVAIEAQRGVHKPTDPAVAPAFMRINNLTGPDAKKRSVSVAPGLIRGSPHPGVVEYCSSGSRMRILLPKQAMLITLALKAVRVPTPSRKSFLPDGTSRIDTPEEPHGDEALLFARSEFVQRDVDVTLSAVDRIGAFLGSVFLVNSKGEKTDVSKMLLASGMGYLHESFDVREPGGSGLQQVEAEARTGKLGLWKDYKEPEVAVQGQEGAGLTDKPVKTIRGTVCEVGFGGRIFVQGTESAGTIKAVEAGLAGLKLDSLAGVKASSLKPAEVVAAKFSFDNLWYRAKILAKTPDGAHVRFLDYGNEEKVKGSDIRRSLGTNFMSKPPAVTEVRLADIIVPGADEVYGVDAGTCLRQLVFGKSVEVQMRGIDRGAVVGDIIISMPAKLPTESVTTSPAAPSAADFPSTSSSPVAPDSGPSPLPSSPSAAESSPPPPPAKVEKELKAANVSIVEKMLESGYARLVRKHDKASKATFARLSEFEKIGQGTRDGFWVYGDAYESDCDDEEETRSRNAGRRGF